MEEVHGVWQEVANPAPKHVKEVLTPEEEEVKRWIIGDLFIPLIMFAAFAAVQIMGIRLVIGLVLIVALSIGLYLLLLKALELLVTLWNK